MSYPIPMTFDISRINDYLLRSVVNLFFGYGLFGVIPLIFSIICRNNKNINNLSRAETMSTLAFVFNIVITIGGVITWTLFIISISIYVASPNNLT